MIIADHNWSFYAILCTNVQNLQIISICILKCETLNRLYFSLKNWNGIQIVLKTQVGGKDV